MSSDLEFGNFGQGRHRRVDTYRVPGSVRRVQQNHSLDLARLAAENNHNEVRAMLRKRAAEDASLDVTQVGQLAQTLAGGDAFLASLLIPIVQEFARQTVNDIRDFGR
ncbi:hypothetical protein [Streptacidiphilus cavernicola]|uniref:Uncharacterized protein n=1 Tax=Streptacidiphilus cavernicola TaxID=3342716 RepID=A0ABV6W064_9ACTN